MGCLEVHELHGKMCVCWWSNSLVIYHYSNVQKVGVYICMLFGIKLERVVVTNINNDPQTVPSPNLRSDIIWIMTLWLMQTDFCCTKSCGCTKNFENIFFYKILRAGLDPLGTPFASFFLTGKSFIFWLSTSINLIKRL